MNNSDKLGGAVWHARETVDGPPSRNRCVPAGPGAPGNLQGSHSHCMYKQLCFGEES